MLGSVAPLVAEIGRELASLITDPILRDRLMSEFGPEDASPQDLIDGLKQAAAASSVQHQAGQAGEEARLLSSAVSSGIVPESVPVLLQLLQRLGGLLVEYGAPARRDASVALLGRMKLEISASLSDAASSARLDPRATSPRPSPEVVDAPQSSVPTQRGKASPLARNLARAMRLLQLLVRQVKLDAANARLRVLSQSLKGGSTGVKYVRDKFLALHSLAGAGERSGNETNESAAELSPTGSRLQSVPIPPQRVASSLPKTLSWLKKTALAIPSMKSYCSGALGGIDLDAALASSYATQQSNNNPSQTFIPSELRSGRGGFTSRSASSAAPSASEVLLRPRLPISSLDCPEALVRAGLVALISGGTQAVGPSLPEALIIDAGELQTRWRSL